MTDKELHWLAGLLEGEGSFLKGPPSNPGCPIITIEMTDEDVISRVASLFGTKMQLCKPRKSQHKASFRARLSGSKAVDLMNRLKPLLGKRRQDQLQRAVDSYSAIPKRKNAQRLSDAMTLLIINLLAQELGPREISRRTGVHHSSVRYIRDKSKTAAALKGGGGCEGRTHATE